MSDEPEARPSPAFPSLERLDPYNGGFDALGYIGMSLRDYFAAKAMQAIVPVADDPEKRRGKWGVQACAKDYAQIAYVLADAMLEARKA